MRRGANPGARNFENELSCQLVPQGPVGEKVGRETLSTVSLLFHNLPSGTGPDLFEGAMDVNDLCCIFFLQVRQILKGKYVDA